MKKLLPFIVLLCLGYSAQATHLMGGEIVVKHITGNDYEVKVTHYRDTFGVPLYNTIHLRVDSLDSSTGLYVNSAFANVPLNPMFSIPLLPNFPYGVEVGVYVDTISLLPGSYRIHNVTCCRNQAIINMSMPLNENIGLYTEFTVTPTGNNNSPDFLLMPITYFPKNVPSNYNPLPYDLDNDSLSWGLNTPIDDVNLTTVIPVTGFVAPSADPSGPLTMNPVTGSITWTPNITGNFVQSFEVIEYRNGVQIGKIIRDYQYVVIDPPPSNMNVPSVTSTQGSRVIQYDTLNEYYYTYYTPGLPCTYYIIGSDVDPGSTLTMNSSSEIYSLTDPAVFTTAMAGNDIVGTLNWNPPTTYNKEVTVVFRLKDGLWTTDYTLVLKPTAPLQVENALPEGLSQLSLYPNPASGNFNLSLELLQKVDAKIELHNTLGQKIDQIYSGDLPRGIWEMNYDQHLSAGLYFVMVTIDGQLAKALPLAIK